jgi:LuxR family maltose regulon positive regulatory protein
MDAGDVESSESSLRDAEVCLDGTSDAMVVMGEKELQTLPARIAFARAYNAQTKRDFAATVRYAELAIKLAPEGDQFMRAGASAMLGGTYWASGDLDAACKAMSDWIDSSLKAGNYIFSIASESGKAEIQTAQGYLREALRTYEQSLQHASTYGREVNQILAHHYLGLALLHHEMGNDGPAEQYFQQSLELGKQSTLVDFPYRKSLAQARLKESEGDMDAALEFLNEAKRLYISTPIPNTRPVEAIKARIYLKQGQLSKAQDWARECGITVNDELSYLREFEHITLARVLIAEHQNTASEAKVQDALGLLSRLLQTAENAKRMGSIIEILTAQGLAFHAHEESSQALASIKHALTLAEPEGYFRFFVNEGKPMPDLLIKLSQSLEDDRLNTYIRKLLNAFDKTNPEPVNAQPLIDPLSERELEVLRLVANGLSNDEISQKLFVALSTIKGHNLRIFNKLQAKSRTEAVARARELGLLP